MKNYILKTKTDNVLVKVYDKTGYYQMVAHIGENKVGEVTFSIKRESFLRKAWLNKISVVERYQNQGIGKALLVCFEKFCLDYRVDIIDGKYFPENDIATHFYPNNGYSIDKDGYETYIYKMLGEDTARQFRDICVEEFEQKEDAEPELEH